MKDNHCITRVEFELTEACNLRCQFCYNSCAPSFCKDPYIILDRLAEAKVLEIILTGGEPSLHPEFLQILDYAKTKIPRVMVQSNGTAFAEPTYAKTFFEKKPFCVNFSLHGPKEIHDYLTRIDGSFEATTTAIKNAVDAGIRVASNLVLTRKNCLPQNLKETVAILAKLGCREMTLTRFIPSGIGAAAKELVLSNDNFLTAIHALETAGNAFNLQLLLANSTPACFMPTELHEYCNRCSFGFDKFYVDVKGTLLHCGMTRQKYGNIIDHPIEEVLSTSALYKAFCGLEHIPEACRLCDQLDHCGGGCRAAALAHSGNLKGKDPLALCQ